MCISTHNPVGEVAVRRWTATRAMPIPTYDKLLDPVLRLAEAQAITRTSAENAMVRHFALTPDEANLRTPGGGQRVIRSRTGWAMTYLTKGALIEKVSPKTYRATSRGIELLAQRPNGI